MLRRQADKNNGRDVRARCASAAMPNRLKWSVAELMERMKVEEGVLDMLDIDVGC